MSFSFAWAEDAVERAVRTYAQGILGFLVADSTFASVDWATAASVSGVAALSSLLMSVLATGKGDPDDASLVK